ILGRIAKEQGRLAAAAGYYEKAIGIKPDFAIIYCDLCQLLLQLDQRERAQAVISQGMVLFPEQADLHYYQGNLHLQAGRHDQAIGYFLKALRLQPGYAQVHHNLEIAFRAQRMRGVAIDGSAIANSLNQEFDENHYWIGLQYQAQGRLDDAIDSFHRVLSACPDIPQIHLALGVALFAHNNLDAAIESYSAALKIKPDYVDAYINLGSALHDKKLLVEAVDMYRKALALRPEIAEVHYNLGLVLKDLGRLDEAVGSYEKALSLKPQYVDAHTNLGKVFREQGKYNCAAESFQNAILLNPGFAEAHSDLGVVLQEQGKLDAAIEKCRHALSLKPDFDVAHSNLLFCLNYHPDFSAEEIFVEYRRWNKIHADPVLRANVIDINHGAEHRRLRIGYVSPDLRYHSARHFIEPLLANHDKMLVETFAYSEVATEDFVTARLKTYVDHWRSTVGLSHDQMASLIRADKIDILVDLAGHTAGNRLLVFAAKPAPIQVSWLGYGYTTGLDAIDYLLADQEFAPENCDQLFSEKLVRLPRWAAYRPDDGMGAVGALPFLQTQRMTFGTLSRAARINHRVVRVWAAILKRVPNADLMINSGNFKSVEMQVAMQRQFAEYGIAADR
ncbi:MAG TPA: tetratricopeptide repeat protein, partial [Methylobacter sp.]